MKIEYDPEADALYIQIREAHADDNIDIEEGVTVDVDEHRHIVGVEILDASKRLSPSDLTNITIQRLPLETTIPWEPPTNPPDFFHTRVRSYLVLRSFPDAATSAFNRPASSFRSWAARSTWRVEAMFWVEACWMFCIATAT